MYYLKGYLPTESKESKFTYKWFQCNNFICIAALKFIYGLIIFIYLLFTRVYIKISQITNKTQYFHIYVCNMYYKYVNKKLFMNLKRNANLPFINIARRLVSIKYSY